MYLNLPLMLSSFDLPGSICFAYLRDLPEQLLMSLFKQRYAGRSANEVSHTSHRHAEPRSNSPLIPMFLQPQGGNDTENTNSAALH